MVRILVGLAAAVVLAAGGFFGFQFYTERRIASEVTAAFEQIRAGGGKASYGKVSFDLASRTLRIADISSESAGQPPFSVKIANVVVTGAGQPDAGRFSADAIEASDMEIRGAGDAAGASLSYRIPRLVIKDYSGPASLQRPPAQAAIIDSYRSALMQFAAVTATSVSVPTMTGTINLGAQLAGEFTYSGMSLQDIKSGKVGAMQVERANFAMNTQQAGKPDRKTGEIASIVSRDFDAAAVAAILDPQKAGDDNYYGIYGKTSAGPYTVTSSLGIRMRIEQMSIDGVGARPSRLQLPELMAMIQSAGSTKLSSAQTREMVGKMATLYEGIKIGNAELRGLSADVPPKDAFKLALIKFNLENGKIGEFAFEGLDTPTPKGPVKVGRFALRSLDIANFIRLSTTFANPAQPPAPDQFLALIPLIEGVEIKGVVAPFQNTNKLVNLDTFDLNWGQFVGSVPSKARLTTRITTPVDAKNPAMLPLVAAGLDTIAADGDISAVWTEAARSFVLDLAKLDIGGLFRASARVSLANVPRQVFSFNLPQAANAAAQVEAGTLELTLRDLGGLDLAIAQYARAQNVSRDAARQAIVTDIRSNGATMAAGNPDAATAAEALARFVETPRTTLILKLTPRAKVPAMQLMQALKADPATALSQFRIEASTAL
ncbi:MAG: hypothetical protein PS018_13440 [bacterium]|nr:hypothetical protein [bacterium]